MTFKDDVYSQMFDSFNQVTVSYDASKEDKVDALKSKQSAVENRLRHQS